MPNSSLARERPEEPSRAERYRASTRTPAPVTGGHPRIAGSERTRPPGRPPGRAPGRVLQWLAVAAVVGLVALLLWWAGGGQMWWELFSDRERLRDVVEDAGSLAPAAFVSLLVLQAVLAPLPAPVVAAAGGYLFGAFWGFALTWLGVLAGGALSFAISRLFGRRFVARSARLEGMDRYVTEHGAIAIFVLRLLPLISFDAISYAAGLTGISFWRFFVATALGAAPGTFAFVYLGTASLGPGLYAVLGGLALLATAAYAYYRRALVPRKARC